MYLRDSQWVASQVECCVLLVGSQSNALLTQDHPNLSNRPPPSPITVGDNWR